jgi:hypothetical protein
MPGAPWWNAGLDQNGFPRCHLGNSERVNMVKYYIQPAIVKGCDCEDCRVGRHIYTLYRFPAKDRDWSAISLQAYSSAEECKQQHDWGIQFEPDAVWDDGTPIVRPRSMEKANEQESGVRGFVALNAKAFAKSAEALKKHCDPSQF